MLKDNNAWTDQIDEIIRQMENAVQVITQTVDSDLMPILERNYNASGIKTHRGVVKRAITKRNAPGNLFKIESGKPGEVRLTVGIDTTTQEGKEAYYAIEGNDPGSGYIYPKTAKALHFTANGKQVIVKRVRAAPSHDTIYTLSGQEEQEFKDKVEENLLSMVESQRKS